MPPWMVGMLKPPSELVVVVRLTPVPLLLIETVASGIDALEASVIVPTIEP